MKWRKNFPWASRKPANLCPLCHRCIFSSTAWSSPSCVVWRGPGLVYQLGIRNEVAAEFLNSHRFTTFTELWMWRLCFLEMNKSNFYRQNSYLIMFCDHLGTTFWDHVLTTSGPLGAHVKLLLLLSEKKSAFSRGTSVHRIDQSFISYLFTLSPL